MMSMFKNVVGWILDRLSRLMHPVRFKHRSWGEDYPEKKFLVIRRRGYGMGLFSYFLTNLGWINYAFENGYVPVVDMKTYRSVYHQSKKQKKRENVWDLFFGQPTAFTLDDISKAKNVTLIEEAALPGVPHFLPSLGKDENIEIGGAPQLEKWRALASKCVVPNAALLNRYASAALEDVLPGGVIGVLARGTDYTRLRPRGHSVQPSLSDFFSAIEEYDASCNVVKPIFLVTEDSEIARKFSDRYGLRLIMSNQECVSYEDGLLCKVEGVSGNLNRGFAYLKAICDLSRCSVLIAGRTSGTVGAAILSKGFSYSKVFSLGNY